MLAASPRPIQVLPPLPTRSSSTTPISPKSMDAPRRPHSPSPSPMIPRKRPASPHEDDDKPQAAAVVLMDTTADASLEPARSSQPRRSRVTCELCSEHISFTDDGNGGFTMRHWDAHRARCHGSRSPPEQHAVLSASVPPAPPSTLAPLLAPIATGSQARTPPMSPPASASAFVTAYPDGPPPPKRRRAKRTEDERIAYFRADPFVAQFEPYRVLCGSCNKWIRLRPNSTYCSIPWESHRKSCLAKNGRLNSSVASRPPPPPVSVPPTGGAPEDDPDADAEGEDDDEVDPQGSSGPISPSASVGPRQATFVPMHMPSDADTSIGAPARGESRRKNETQRREALLADRLLSAVEPNRVYCSLCQKWVQLRQDSTYCAYPWVQHRAKCIVRNQRRVEKATEQQQRQAVRTSESVGGAHGWTVHSQSGGRAGPGSDGEDELASAASGTSVPSRPDLSSADGRVAYVVRAVGHLFATTYERGVDPLPLPALVSYLNAALPADKHAPFAQRDVADALIHSGFTAGVDLGEYAPALLPASPTPAASASPAAAPVEDKMATLIEASANEAKRMEDEDQLMAEPPVKVEQAAIAEEAA